MFHQVPLHFFQNRHMVLAVCMLSVNVITFILFGADKWKAVHGTWRIRERTLLGLVVIGGSAWGLLGMYIFRHKTKKQRFSKGIPVIFVVHIVILVYLRAAGYLS